MKLKQFTIRIGLLAAMVAAFVACDKDYNTIGTDILADQNFSTGSVKFPVVAYTKALKPVRSNNLTTALLGVYNDPVYGVTSASIVSQLTPATYSPDFGLEPEIDSIILTIPYFSHKTGEVVNENTEYELDSIFGTTPFNLTVYQNNYFLRDYDPETNLEDQQLYYSNSNQTINFDNHAGQLLYGPVQFTPSTSEIVLYEYNEEITDFEETERLAPSLRVNLLSDDTLAFWENLLFFDQDLYSYFTNANNFKEYFRGIYLKAEPIADNGNMFMFNLGSGTANVTVYYSYLIESTIDEDGDEDEERNTSSIRFSLSGNSVNVIENNFTPVTDGDAVNGDDVLYLKGMEGSMAVIDLFNGMVQDEDGTEMTAMDYFNTKFKDEENNATRLINEANLVFYVKQDEMDGQEPDRVLLYDLKNKAPIVDYFYDIQNTNSPLYSRTNFSRLLTRDEDGNGVKYKLRLTEHINNILLRDSTNVKLGLVVSTNVNTIDPLNLLDADSETEATTLPSSSFLSPKGTVLHGSTGNVPLDTRVQLEIFYSEPNQD